MDAILQVTGLSRRFGARQALAPLDFRLAAGEVLGLLGPNGAGKTTCLQLLAGCLAPSAGRIEIAGIDLGRVPRQAKQRIGYAPERPPLYADMRVDEYLRHCAQLRRLPPGERAAAVTAVLRDCQLEPVARRLLGQLSKGYRQRVGIAQALIHRPALLLLDEPADGLDPVQTRALRELIARRAADGAIVLSSHRLDDVRASCRRAMILDRGHLLHDTPLPPPAPTDPALRLRLLPPTQPQALQRLPSVARAEALAGDARLRVWLAAPATAAQLNRELIEQGFGVLELTPEPNDLERWFFRGLGVET